MAKTWNFRVANFNPANSSFMKGLGEPYLADLGRVIAAWSHVESQFHVLFLSFVAMKGASAGRLSDPEVVRLMGMSLDRQIRAFKLRMRESQMPEEMRSEIERVLDALAQLRRERDRAAHSMMNPIIELGKTTPQDKAQLLYKSWKNQKPYETKTVRSDDLVNIFERIHSLWFDLLMLSINREWRDRAVMAQRI